MKKSIIAGVIVASLLVATPALASQRQAETRVDGVWYDKVNHLYLMETVDKQGEGFVCELFGAKQENTTLTKLMNKLYLNKKAITYYDDMGTTDIYDDQITGIDIE